MCDRCLEMLLNLLGVPAHSKNTSAECCLICVERWPIRKVPRVPCSIVGAGGRPKAKAEGVIDEQVIFLLGVLKRMLTKRQLVPVM